jgi:hypothetical protein
MIAETPDALSRLTRPTRPVDRTDVKYAEKHGILAWRALLVFQTADLPRRIVN